MFDPEIRSDEEIDVKLDMAVEHVKIAHGKVFHIPEPVNSNAEFIWDEYLRTLHISGEDC